LTPSVERFRRFQWFAQRSPSWSSPDSSRLPFPHRSRPCPFGTQPREGVWSLRLHADSEGPSLISFATSWRKPGRPEELHLQSPTDPYVSLSTRTARASLSRAASPLHGDAESSSLLPVAWLASPLLGLAPPLRSLLITRSSPLLREHPPPPGASLLSPFVGFTYRVFSLPHPASSHVP
jgi:hypothetical protein